MKSIYHQHFARSAAVVFACVLLTVAAARADEIRVVTSATFKPAYFGIDSRI